MLYGAISLLIVDSAITSESSHHYNIQDLVQVGLLGFFIGDILWFLGLVIAVISLPHTDAMENTIFVVLTTVSFTVVQ